MALPEKRGCTAMNKIITEEYEHRRILAEIDERRANEHALNKQARFEAIKVLIAGLSAGMGLLIVEMALLKLAGIITFT